MKNVKVFTDKGLEEFSQYIQRIKAGGNEDPPIDFLDQPLYSKEFTPSINIDIPIFMTRHDLGKYLSELFSNINRNDIVGLPGLWSWLALQMFDQLCPVSDDGQRKVREIARYVCSTDYTDYYRHLVAASWDIYCLYGENINMFLSCPIYIHNDFMEQLGAKQDIITIKGLIGAADKLYWDSKKKRQKKNSSNRKVPGNLRRLITLAGQFKLTYDLHAMQAEDIISLLPKEFNKWKK